jgi:hypothetical protein
MADSTAIILIDSTSTDIQNLEATVANSLVADFASKMGPIAAKCDKLSGQTNRIKDTISGMTPSGTSLLDELIAKALHAAFQSSAWALAGEVYGNIESVLARCSYFQDAAGEIAKYADPSKFLKSLGAAAVAKADQVIQDVIDSFGDSGDFPELGIGKTLSDIASTGRAVYDKVEKAVEDIEEAISPIIEQGKAAINVVQTELAGAAKELGKLDKLVECLSGIGGPDFASDIDDMIDQLNCYYDKLGVYSDPNFANFGEFDVDTYLDGIGALSPESAANIKKSMNLYSKARNNAEGAIEKAADVGIKTPSALNPSAKAETTKKKTAYTEEASKTSYVVPAIPGKTEERTVTIPTPDPVTKPPIVSAPPPVPENLVAYTTYVKETEVTFFEDYQTRYDKYDPEHSQFPQYLSGAHSTIQGIKVEEPSTEPNIKLWIYLISHSFTVKGEAGGLFEENKYLPGGTFAVQIAFENTSTGKISTSGNVVSIWGDNWISESEYPFEDKDRARALVKPLLFKGLLEACKKSDFNATDVQSTL